MTDMNIQDAINCISERLTEMADGAEAPPSIEFDVEWIDVSTIERRAWHPHVTIRASCTKTVSIADI